LKASATLSVKPPPEQIRDHFNWPQTSASISSSSTCAPRQLFDLTVITRDRGRLFADVAGALAAMG